MNQIKRARVLSGLTQVELAKQLGVTAGAVSQWELGNTFPGPKRLVKLAQLLNTTADELLAKTEGKEAG